MERTLITGLFRISRALNVSNQDFIFWRFSECNYINRFIENTTHMSYHLSTWCTAQWIIGYSQSFATAAINFTTFSSAHKETLHPSAVTHSTSCHSSFLGDHWWTFHFYRCVESGHLPRMKSCNVVFCKWLPSLCIKQSSFACVVACVSTSFNLWLDHILLYGAGAFNLCIHEQMDIWVISPICFY
jgi:hypothetical protein